MTERECSPDMETPLLPCPFCGGTAEETDAGSVMCSNEGCKVICGVPSNSFRPEWKPRAIWNTRASVAQGSPCENCDFFNMLWAWFEERRGSEDMRANIPDGISADDFKDMLDEHEQSLIEDATTPSSVSSTDGGPLTMSMFTTKEDLEAARAALSSTEGKTHE